MTIPEFVAYHHVSSSDHQRRFDELYKGGFRIITLTVYGDRNSPSYAAVWVQRAGPPWAAVHGIDAQGFQTAFDQWASSGFKPTIIVATGRLMIQSLPPSSNGQPIQFPLRAMPL